MTWGSQFTSQINAGKGEGPGQCRIGYEGLASGARSWGSDPEFCLWWPSGADIDPRVSSIPTAGGAKARGWAAPPARFLGSGTRLSTAAGRGQSPAFLERGNRSSPGWRWCADAGDNGC